MTTMKESQMLRVWKETVVLLKMAAAYHHTSVVALVHRLAQEECVCLHITMPETHREDKRVKAQKE